MQKNSFRILLVVGTVFLSMWFLYPTYKANEFQNKLSSFTDTKDSLDYVKQNKKDIDKSFDKQLKLGLDLKGGMYVVLEVDVIELLEKRAKNKDDFFYKIMSATQKILKETISNEPVTQILYNEFKKQNIRMSRYYYELRDSDEDILKKLQSEAVNAVTRAKEIIRNRVDQYGVAEPSIATKGESRIIIELPGISDKSRVRNLLKGTAKLEFKLLRNTDISSKTLKELNTYLAYKNFKDSVAKIDTMTSSKLFKVFEARLKVPDSLKTASEKARQNPLLSKFVTVDNGMPIVSEYEKTNLQAIFNRADVKEKIGNDIEFALEAKGNEGKDGLKYYRLYTLKKQAELDGSALTEAKVTFSSGSSRPEVSMKMNDEGTRVWARVTGANIGKQIAIVLDGNVFQAPVVNSKIPNGSSVIQNMGSVDEAQDLEVVLKAGALPAPVHIVEERTVGPSLGADSIQAGMDSMLFGFIAVFIFMVVYYRSAGFIANIAVVFNIFFVIAFLAGFGATLTLPGIAGLVLTVGMAVDSNVLIFERIREEIAAGKILKLSVEQGYKHAFSAVFDSHITTFIGGALLYTFGIGPIQGFAITLMIGIGISLFTAVVITKIIYDWMLENNKLNPKSFG